MHRTRNTEIETKKEIKGGGGGNNRDRQFIHVILIDHSFLFELILGLIFFSLISNVNNQMVRYFAF